MSNIFAAENNERIRLDNISRTIHMFAKMTNDEKRFARDNASKSSNVLSSRGIFLSVRESRDRRLRATPARIERGRLIPRKSSARARPRLHRGSARRRIAEGAPPREQRDTRRGPIHTKRAVTLYIGDGEARERGAAARCQNKRHYRDLSRFP